MPWPGRHLCHHRASFFPTTLVHYRLAIFDFDGTLADSFPWFITILNDVADRYRFRRIAPEELDALRRLGARQILSRVGIPWWKVPFVARHVRTLAAARAHTIAPFPGLEPVLERLEASGVTLALVTSNGEPSVSRILSPALLARFRHRVFGAPMLAKHVAFKKVLKESGTPAEGAIAIGDELRDLDAARKAGIASGAVSWGYTHPDALAAAGPTLLFRTLDELAERLSAPAPISAQASDGTAEEGPLGQAAGAATTGDAASRAPSRTST